MWLCGATTGERLAIAISQARTEELAAVLKGFCDEWVGEGGWGGGGASERASEPKTVLGGVSEIRDVYLSRHPRRGDKR